MNQVKYAAGFKVVKTHESELSLPYRWKKPRIVFVNSMSDMFHDEVPLAFIQRTFDVMNDCQHHTFQVLTKRGDNLEAYSSLFNWTPNIWMGVSVEDSRVVDRIDYLRKTGAAVKFLSIEPLLGPLPSLNLSGIDWVIVGGESGRNARPMKEEWVQDIRRQCEDQGVAFFFKQWGGVNKKLSGRLLNNRTYDEMPDLSVSLS